VTKQERNEALQEKRSAWQQHIQSWQQSGLTQIAYCRRHDLKLHCFVYWRDKFVPKAETTCPGFVEIATGIGALGLPRSCGLQLEISDRYRIQVHRDFDPVALRQLLHVLGQL
jgi:hypothetical protein